VGRKRVELVPGPWYSTEQAAKALGVTRPTVARWIDAGRFERVSRPGAHRKIAHAALMRFARERNIELPEALAKHREGRGRVLIVDDELDFAEMVAEFLQLVVGAEVAVADTGFQAGQEVERFRPHLILLDLMMPDMNGFDALRRLRAHPSTASIPVVACTAYRDPSVDERVVAARFDAFIEKPVDFARLREVTERFLPQG
jgi:excisionase family DNA binding protein